MEMTFTVFSPEQMEAIQTAVRRIEAAIQKLIEAAEQMADSIQKLMSQVFPAKKSDLNFCGVEAKRRISANDFLKRILLRPHFNPHKFLQRWVKHEVDD